MTNELRLVFDTNAVVSVSLFQASVARRALDAARARGKLLLSYSTLSELEEVLRRERFDKYLDERDRIQFLLALVKEAVLIEVGEIVDDCRDPKDNKFLEFAVSGNATCIVTGDRDLLCLNPFLGIPIMTPRSFLTFAEQF